MVENNIKLVILDFDGTIADTKGIIVKTMLETARKLHLRENTLDEYASTIGLPLEKTFQHLLGLDDSEAATCAMVYREIFFKNNSEKEVSIFPNVRKTIISLYQRGILLTIASSRSRASIEDFMLRFHLKDYVPYILGASDVKHCKPHPEAVRKTLKENKIKPFEAIVVGDTVYDVEMAHLSKVKAIGVTYGNGKKEELLKAKAEYIIDDFKEILSIV